MMINPRNSVRAIALCCSSILLVACGSDNNNVAAPPPPPPPPPPPVMASFEVTVTNLSNGQPLSPVAVIAHQSGYSVFTVGVAATAGLEMLAEGGDNSALIAEADADSEVMATATGAAPIGPAGSEAMSIEVLESELPGLNISVSTMLVNTNDAITGLNGALVAAMQPGEIMTWRTIAYDSGTEANTEQALHIPGPAGGGEGFNAARDDLADQVAMHSGIVSQDDGAAGSDLTGQHRFDNPVAQVRIERVN